MIEPGDQTALLGHIIELASDIKQRQHLSENGVATIQTTYDRNQVFIILEALYEKLLAS